MLKDIALFTRASMDYYQFYMTKIMSTAIGYHQGRSSDSGHSVLVWNQIKGHKSTTGRVSSMQKLARQRGSHTSPAYMSQLDVSERYTTYPYNSHNRLLSIFILAGNERVFD